MCISFEKDWIIKDGYVCNILVDGEYKVYLTKK